MWPPFVERIERALQLARKINAASLIKGVIDEIEQAINRHKDDPKAGLLPARLMESLLAFDAGDALRYSTFSEELARSLAANKAWDFAEEYWRIASEWYHKAGKQEDAKRARLEAAETFAKKAEDNLQ